MRWLLDLTETHLRDYYHLQRVLHDELASGSPALSDPEASPSMCKMLKVSYSINKKTIPTVAAISLNSPKIYYGMILFQKLLPPDLVTFRDISDYTSNKLMQSGCRICCFVTSSWKFNEKFGEKNEIKYWSSKDDSTTRNQVRPKQFQKVLRLPESNIYLVKFLINDWSSNIRYCDVLEAK